MYKTNDRSIENRKIVRVRMTNNRLCIFTSSKYSYKDSLWSSMEMIFRIVGSYGIVGR